MSIKKVMYGNGHISLLHDSKLSNILNFCFYLFYCNRKEKDHIRKRINSKNKNIYAWNQYYYYFVIKVGYASANKKSSCLRIITTRLQNENCFLNEKKLNPSKENHGSTTTAIANLIFLANTLTPSLIIFHLE